MGSAVKGPLWRHRSDAGCELSQRLLSWMDDPSAVVVGLPRGGVVVAAEIAKTLHLPLISWAVRKVAHPANPELALGALAPGGILIWDPQGSQLEHGLQAQLVEQQQHELDRRQRLYGDPPLEQLRGRSLIVVDDGIATGLTVRAALRSLKAAEPRALILAVPVVDRRIAHQLRLEVDQLTALAEVSDLWAVGAWYETFNPISDKQVLETLHASSKLDAHSFDAISQHSQHNSNFTI